MSTTPDVGLAAPDFTLPGLRLIDGEVRQGGFTLSEQLGHPVVLAFYPGDDTSVCTKQMCAYSSGLEQFADLNATVWGISPQGLESHEKFARKHSLRLPLLADTEREVTAAYGIGFGSSLRRAVFIIDAQGIVRWKHVALLGLTYRNTETLTEQLAALASV
jgi:thioredoxin-dependent peroxiredoxin